MLDSLSSLIPRSGSALPSEQIHPQASDPIVPFISPEATSAELFTLRREERAHTEIDSQLDLELQEFQKELEEGFQEYKARVLKQLQKRALRIEVACRKRYLEEVNALQDQYEGLKRAKN